MDKIVIGYYTEIDDKVLDFHDTTIDEFLNAKFHIRFAVIQAKGVLRDETKKNTENNELQKAVTENVGTCVEILDSNTLKVVFDSPVPYSIFKKYYSTDKPIFETEA